MMNREDVISHLQIMHTWAEFAWEKDKNFFNDSHMKSIAEWTMDTIAVMKEQITKPKIEGDSRSTWWYVCEECHTAIDQCDKYCRQCGRYIMWE